MIACIYPGQGSQQPGMGKFLVQEFQIARQTFEEASDAIHFDLKKLCFEGSESDLALTENTQPALLTVSTALHRVLASISQLKPVAAAGHSIGEYAAVVNAGACDFSAAVGAVRARGQAMQSAVPVGQGAMAAVIGLEDSVVREICAWASAQNFGPLEPANFNAPGQVVISGKKTVLEWLEANYTNDGRPNWPTRLKMIPLKVSAPFHCSLMEPAESTMRRVLGQIQFSDAGYPIVQNYSAAPTLVGASLRENLVRQVSASVRWVECVQGLKTLGARVLLELGPGKVLAGLVKKIDSENLTALNINSLGDLKAVENQLLDLGKPS